MSRRNFLLGPWLLKVVEMIVRKGPEAPRIKKLRLPDKWELITAEVIRRLLNPPSGNEREDYRPRLISAVTDWLVDDSQYVPFVRLILDVAGAVRKHYLDDVNALAKPADYKTPASGTYNPLTQMEQQEYENAEQARADREREAIEAFYQRVQEMRRSAPIRHRDILYHLLVNALREALELDAPHRSNRDIAAIVGGGSRTRALVSALDERVQRLKSEHVSDDLADLAAIAKEIEATTDESVKAALRAPLESRLAPTEEPQPNGDARTAPKAESARDERGLAGIDRQIMYYQHDTSWYTKPSFAAGAAAEERRRAEATAWIAEQRRQAAAEYIAFQQLQPQEQLQMIATKIAEAKEKSRTLKLNDEAREKFYADAARAKARTDLMGKLAERFQRSVETIRAALEALEGPALAAGVDLDRLCFGNLVAQQPEAKDA